MHDNQNWQFATWMARFTNLASAGFFLLEANVRFSRKRTFNRKNRQLLTEIKGSTYANHNP
jgi:hypothetical protein